MIRSILASDSLCNMYYQFVHICGVNSLLQSPLDCFYWNPMLLGSVQGVFHI